MTKEKLKSLRTYKAQLTDKLNNPIVPTKHVSHVVEYRRFLVNEIRIVAKTLEEEALLASPAQVK